MQVALDMTYSMFGYQGTNDCSDAFRHAYFNAINARDCSVSLAKEFGEAHECFENNQQAVVMDLFNNEVGHSIATYYNTLSEAQLGNVVMNHLQNGELQYIKNGSLVWR